MTDIPTLEAQLFMQVARRLPVTLVRGEGTRVWDADGKEYLDFVAGISTCTFGHADPGLVAAISEQAGKLIHVSNIFYTEPQIELAQLLIDHSPLDRVFFANSGAEANEGALKLARKWGRTRRDGAYEIIVTQNGFHGRTMGAVAATGTAAYRESFEPLVPGFVHVDFDDVEAIQAATSAQTAAVMLEPIQAEGGINVPGDGYLRAVREWCDDQNLLLILDEVQVGMGRTGTLWAHEQAGIAPDIMTSAEGARRRRAGLGGAGQGARRGLRARRPRHHLRRAAAGHRRGGVRRAARDRGRDAAERARARRAGREPARRPRGEAPRRARRARAGAADRPRGWPSRSRPTW